MTDSEIRVALRLPDFLPVTTDLRLQILALTGSRRTWLTDNARLIDWLLEKGHLADKVSPSADNLLAYIDSPDIPIIPPGRRRSNRGRVPTLPRAALNPATKLTMLSRALGFLELVGRPVTVSSALKGRLTDLRKTKSDARLVTVAISDSEDVTAITIDDLFPEMPTNLGDAVDRLAAVGIGWFAGRPQEGVQVPLNRIRRGTSGYYVDRAWSKTDSRTFNLPQHVIDAANLVAKFMPEGARHRIGIDPDHELPTCCGTLIPRLDTARRRVKPGAFNGAWLGSMLKRRVRAFALDKGLRIKDVEAIVALVTGKAMRRGRNASAAAAGDSTLQQAYAANLRTKSLLIIYADGIRLSGSPIEHFILGRLPEALREPTAQLVRGSKVQDTEGEDHSDIRAA